jgi:hypothetical protein
MRAQDAQIVAARTGVVAAFNFGGKWDTWCNSNTDCANKGGVWRGNHVIINHPDGSQSYYLHMRGGTGNGSLYVGRDIAQGTPLGIQGYTGFTCSDLVIPCTTPDAHVHFQVNKNGSSYPTPFEDCNYNGNVCNSSGATIEGNYYVSTNWIPGYQASNQRSKSIDLYGTSFSLGLDSLSKGSQTRLGNYLENDGSKWEWMATGEIKGINELCLAVTGRTVYLNDCSGTNVQKWDRGVKNSIINRQTGECLDSTAGLTYNSRVATWPCHNLINQQWRYGNEPYLAKPQ